MFAFLLVDILEKFSNCECLILSDTAFGACCIDDIQADLLKADLIVHYGHSCLIPVTECVMKILYVFVDIYLDLTHLIETFILNFPDKQQQYLLVGTIQFNQSIHQLKQILAQKGYSNIIIPQEKPRSAGEVLGCTSPIFPYISGQKNIVLSVSDGRFHIESSMIANPKHIFYQYNPYNSRMTVEQYDNEQMMKERGNQIQNVQNLKNANVGIILGILGRQGSLKTLKFIEQELKEQNCPYMVFLISEITDQFINSFKGKINFFIQLACPRLSIDWGYTFQIPLLTAFEFFALKDSQLWNKNCYPMDNYSNNGGKWTRFYQEKKAKIIEYD